MTDVLVLPPLPATALGRYRKLSPLAGLHVSPVTLGGLNIGVESAKWAPTLGEITRESSFAVLDAFYEAGGNFIDTANSYYDGDSERLIGEWAEKRGIRDQLVIATKYTSNYKNGNSSIKQQAVYTGNHLKNMRLSLKESLKNLRTHYIDIFYVNWWDFLTPIEEVMNGLHNLVVSGKVLYLGISDTPAWIVSKANQYARNKGKTPFSIYQGQWNLLARSFERDIIPMARSEGLALAPWGCLAEGRFRTDGEEEERERTGEKGRKALPTTEWKRSEPERIASRALERVANEVGAKCIQSVAIAYLMQKIPYVFPVVGVRKVPQLFCMIEALEIHLADEHISYLEGIDPFDVGFPGAMVGTGTSYPWLYHYGGHFEYPTQLKALRPAPKEPQTPMTPPPTLKDKPEPKVTLPPVPQVPQNIERRDSKEPVTPVTPGPLTKYMKPKPKVTLPPVSQVPQKTERRDPKEPLTPVTPGRSLRLRLRIPKF